jgi:hypothetical protein
MTSVHDVTYDLLRRHGVKNLIIRCGQRQDGKLHLQ